MQKGCRRLSKLRVFYLLGVVLLGFTIVSLVDSTRDASSAEPVSLLTKVAALAATGDAEAQDQLTRLHNFCADTSDGGCPELPAGLPVSLRYTYDDLRVQVSGLQPFWLKVYPETEFKTVADIDAYISKRKPAVSRLRSNDPTRIIEVSISPSDYMTIPAMWNLKAKYGLDVDQLGTNWFDNTGGYAGSMNVGDPREEGEKQRVNFNASAATVESQLKQFQSSIPQPPDRVLVRSGLTPKVRWVRGTLTAENASKLMADPGIMLVDPITDIHDVYKARALDVRVVDMPQVLIHKKRIVQKSLAP